MSKAEVGTWQNYPLSEPKEDLFYHHALSFKSSRCYVYHQVIGFKRDQYALQFISSAVRCPEVTGKYSQSAIARSM
jgi:hypothetical protein